MRAVVQRVSRASVTVDGQVVGSIRTGLVVLLGVAGDDGAADIDFMTSKILGMRIFDDADGRMHRSVTDVGGELLVVSQFTLLGDLRKGRRPSFDAAAGPDDARALYDDVVERLRAGGPRVETGVFQAHMHVELVNDGPVTVLLDSRRQF